MAQHANQNWRSIEKCMILLRAILNKSWRQHPTRHQLYGHLPPITKTIQVRRSRHAGHCWRSKDELISDELLWTPTYGQAKAGRPAQTYIQQLCEDTGCNPEDLPEAMNNREKWRERVRGIRAGSMTWWWWWLLKILRITFWFTPEDNRICWKLNKWKYVFLLWTLIIIKQHKGVIMISGKRYNTHTTESEIFILITGVNESFIYLFPANE